MVIHQGLLLMLQNTSLLEVRKRNEYNVTLPGNAVPSSPVTVMLSYALTMYTLVVWVFEGQFPYDTIITNHD